MSRRRAGDSSAPVYRACCAAPSRKCVQVIAEIFGDDPFSENVLPTMAHAKEALLAPNALVMPGRLRVVAALAASHELWSQNRSAGASRCLAPDLVVPTLQPSLHRRPRPRPSRAEPRLAGVVCRRRHRWLCAALEKPGVDRPLHDRRFGRTLARAPFVRNGWAAAKPSAASLPVGAWKPAWCKRAELRLDDRWSLVHSCVCTDVFSPGSKLSWYPHCILEQQGCGASRLPHS